MQDHEVGQEEDVVTRSVERVCVLFVIILQALRS